MKAMQIRVNRRSIIHLVTLALAAVVWLGASPAFAQSTTVTPAGQSFTATANGTAPAAKVTLTLGTVTVTCNSSTTGTVPASPANQNPSGAVCGPIGTPTFTGCTCNLPFCTATVTASGAWNFCAANNGGSPTGTLTVPQNGVFAKVTSLGVTCTATAAPAGPVNVTGAWSNGTTPTLKFTSAPVLVQPTGGGICPTGTSSSLSGTYAVSPTITVGP